MVPRSLKLLNHAAEQSEQAPHTRRVQQTKEGRVLVLEPDGMEQRYTSRGREDQPSYAPVMHGGSELDAAREVMQQKTAVTSRDVSGRDWEHAKTVGRDIDTQAQLERHRELVQRIEQGGRQQVI